MTFQYSESDPKIGDRDFAVATGALVGILGLVLESDRRDDGLSCETKPPTHELYNRYRFPKLRILWGSLKMKSLNFMSERHYDRGIVSSWKLYKLLNFSFGSNLKGKSTSPLLQSEDRL